ncbi:MAG: DUF4091 domain-containing protein [Oscillospiraceae bacterium]|nr:DUF4091 domain-containing protein [Oscillospiraceae bacterium]
MQKNLCKVLSCFLAIIMVLGMIPTTVFANEAQAASNSDLPTVMEGLSIAYPYNTEMVQQTGNVPDRFDALTFESARNETESAQLILTPNFDVTSFELTMNGLQNEKGNIIPGWAFEVYTQHYVSISGAGNAPYWTKDSWLSGTYMFKPRGGKTAASGVYPDALIPMDAAIAAGENKISAGKNGGLWVNLNVQDAAPGTYTGFATLTVNGTAMQIPVSVRIYDVAVPEEVHMESCFPIWWDQLQAGEGYIDRNLADAYFDYIVSKRLSPMDAWNISRWDDSLADYAASYLAVSPEISSYNIPFTRNSDGTVDTAAMKATLTALINKNLELAAAGSNVDLFKKAYYYLYDEPETNAEYKAANEMTAQMDAVKNELAPMLDAYPELKASFLGIKNLVTAQHPNDSTYDKMWQDVGNTVLTGSAFYCPQYQYLNTEAQRALYANEEKLWWYGCCFPTEPFATYQINSPLIASRANGWMMYDYGIDGMLYSSVNYWGTYNNDGSITQLSYWTGYNNNGTPGDGMLVYPGSAYGVYGPIGTVRLENIRESNEEYEYLWLLENAFGISDISTYTKGLYEGVIVTGVYDGQTIDPDGDGNTDAVSIYYNSRKALLAKLEQLNVAANGATEIQPGQEGFVRGEAFTAGVNFQKDLDQTKTAAGLSLEYKITDGEKIGVALLSDWSNFYGYYNLYADGIKNEYEGVYVQQLDDGYVRVIFDLSKLNVTNGAPTPNIDLLFVRGANTSASGYFDKIQLLDEIPEIETPVTYRGEEIVVGQKQSIYFPEAAAYDVVTFDMIVPAAGGENEIGFCLYQDGSNYLGYFYLEKTGLENNYSGVSAEQLDDGYWRVTLDVDQITDSARVHGAPEIFDRIYIRNHTTGGYIDNVQCIIEEPVQPEAPKQEFEGGEFVAGSGITVSMDNAQAVTKLSFDYKLTSEGHMNVALLPDWSSYYGYFKLDANGECGDYKGVTTQKIENGYIRVYIDLADVNYIAGTPSDVITMIYVRGNYTTANGEITNIRLNESAYTPYRGKALTPGVNQQIDLDATEEIATLSFDYKIVGSGHMQIALLPNWSAYFGYFKLDANGEVGDYVGVTTEKLEDGYIRVAMNLNDVTAMAGTPSTIIDFLYIRGDWTTANGYIDNVQYTLKKDMPRGQFFEAGKQTQIMINATEEVSQISFDYKLIEGKKFDLALLPDWSSYFGYFGFMAEGTEGIYNGVTTETLEDSYIHVTIDLDQLTQMAGTPSKVISFLYLRTDWGNGAGYIDNVQYTVNTHTHNHNAVVTAPTCTAGGYTTYTCDCGDTYTGDATEALGHNYESVVTAPTMSAQGYTTHTCANCGDSYVDSYTDFVLEGYLVLTENMEVNLTLNQDLYVDLNGHTMSGVLNTNGFKVYGMDAATNNYTCETLGYFSCVDAQGNAIVPESDVKTDLSGSVMRYVTIATESGYTFHRFYVGITKQSLAPQVTGVGYKAEFYADEMVQAQVGGIGYNLWLEGGKAISRDHAFQNYLTLRVKNFDAVNYGETNLYANVWMTIGDVTINSSEYSLTLRQMVEAVNADVSAYSEEQLQAARDMIERNPVMQNWQVENLYQKEVVRGQEIAPSTDLTLPLNCSEELESVSFDYKVTSGSFNIALLPDWSNYFGYFAFDAAGMVDNYDGVTVETLDDGYIRATFDLSALTKYTGTPGAVLDCLYVRGDWSDATGYIDNVQFVVAEVPETPEVNRGEKIEPGVNMTPLSNTTAELESVSFEYKVISGRFNIALMSDWQNFYGYFAFNAEGNVDSYDGVTVEPLEDGYIRVTFDMAALTKYTNTPTAVLEFLYIRGDWSDATGYIDNIQFVAKDQPETSYRGQKITVGESLSIMADQPDNYSQVVMDIIVPAVGGENEIGIALLDADWEYYGYFYLENTGLESNYAGVSAEQLEDGYWRVTIDIANITDSSRIHGDVGDIERVYINNHTTDGYIDNVEFIKEEISVDIEARGRKITSGEGLTWDMGAGTFSTVTMEYAITNGGTFSLAVCGSWSDFYGYYSFDANGTVGSYAGISTEKLEDGYVRVTFDVAALNVTAGAPTRDLKFLYISGSKNTANGYIDKVSVVDYREEVIRGEAFTSGTNWSMFVDETTYGAVTFDYKITDDGKIAVALLDTAFSKYYGYFEFDKNGATRTYNGVTTTKRSDGYIYVTFDVDALTNISSSGEPEALGAIRIRGSASTANGYIDSVQFKESLNPTGVRFGVLSDVHLGNDDTYWASNHLKNALTIYKNRGVDAIVMTGDLQNHYKDPYTVEDCKAWIENLADVWFEVFPDGINDLTGEPVEPILIYGNHDQLLVAEEYWPERFGEYTDAYLKEVNGYYFVGAMYQRESAAATLVDYAEENSNGYPFFYMQHCPMIDILYGEDLDATDFETGMTMRDDLWNVSNAITFSGHTHLPATDERSIYQPSDADDAQFTAIQVPSLNYARLSDLGYDVPGDASASKQGLYVVVEGSEVNVSRLSFADSNYPEGESIGADWVFDAADPEDKPYGYETRANATNKPEFAADAKIEVLSNSGDSVAFQFPAATVTAPEGFSDQIQSYYIETVNVATGETVNTQSFVTNYFMDAKEANFAGPYNITVNGLAEETTYEIRVYAKEYYQVSSEPLTLQIITTKSVVRGTALVAGESLQIATNTTEKLAAISFDYKIVSGERFNVALITHDWSNYFGYIPCYASGYRGSDPGVSYEILADGYVRVTLDLDKLTTCAGEPSNVVELLYIRGSWSDANGYIDNIQYVVAEDEPEVPTEPEPTEPEPTEPEVTEPTEPEVTEPVIRGKAFDAGANSYLYTDCTDNMTQFSFEYKVTNDGAMDVLIGNDNGQYGNFYLNANGTVISLSDTTAKNYAGVTTEVLADGYIRVTFQLDELTTVYRGTPGSVISYIRIRATTTASGYVDNVQWDAAQTDVIRGEAFTAGSSKRIAFTEGVYSTVTFDYKITEGTEMQFAVLQDSAGSAYYGRFTLIATGEKTDYAGVEVQALSDGYYRVTINIAEVTVANGTPSVLSTFYIRGSGTNASGYIDNLQVA